MTVDYQSTTTKITQILSIAYYYYYTRLTASFPGQPWVNRYQKGKKSEFKWGKRRPGRQWHQLDHMQTICTSLQTDNHTNTSTPTPHHSISALPYAKTSVSKHWRQISRHTGAALHAHYTEVQSALGWLSSRVVSMLDSGAEGPGFKSQSRRCLVTVLGKLFTPIVPLFTKQQNW